MLQTRRGANGQTYTYAPVRLAMRLNATEIQAQVLFEHGDKTYRCVKVARGADPVPVYLSDPTFFLAIIRSPATVVTDTHTDAA